MIANFLFFALILILALIGVTLAELPVWLINYFGKLNIEQILFTLTMKQEGANIEPVLEFIAANLKAYVLTVLFIVFASVIYKYYIDNIKYNVTISLNVADKFNIKLWDKKSAKRLFVVTLVLFVLASAMNLAKEFGVLEYYNAYKNPSTLYEDHFIETRDVKITFPENKRNLIFITLESMEESYQNYKLDDGQVVNLTPNLTQISNQNYTFKDSQGLSSLQMAPSIYQTISSLVAMTSGSGFTVPIGNNNYGSNGEFLPGITTIGEVLEDNGYNNYFIMGSDKKFAGRDTYFETHGNYDIFDVYSAREQGLIPEDYWVFWGYEDKKLFEYAKNQLTEISNNDHPFNYTMLTVDSHFMDGYTDPSCPQNYDTAYANAISCADTLIAEFIEWLQEQPFYDNTTIILTGDHYTMNNQFMENQNQENRRIYHTIINPPFEFNTKNRSMASVDWYPTTLALLNAKIEGDRLGFGTNLTSSKKTLSEEYGYDLFKEISKKNYYYENKLLTIKER